MEAKSTDKKCAKGHGLIWSTTYTTKSLCKCGTACFDCSSCKKCQKSSEGSWVCSTCNFAMCASCESGKEGGCEEEVCDWGKLTKLQNRSRRLQTDEFFMKEKVENCDFFWNK